MNAAVGTQEGDRVFKLIRPQAGFIMTKAKYPAYVGSWGTGKSTSGIGRIMRLAKFDNNLLLVGRQEFVDLRDSTVKDFEDYTGFKVNSDREVKLANGTTIMFRHLEELNNIQNINLGGFWIEQAEELESDNIFFKLQGRLRRNVPERSGFVTANTNGHNWIYKLWKYPKEKDPQYPLFEANSFEAGAYLPQDTLADWRALKDKKPEIYNRFVMNSWEESDTTAVIIQPRWVEAAAGRDILVRPPVRRVVSVDVSRYGDDKTVAYALENNKVIGREEWEKKSTMETVGRTVAFAKRTKDIRSFAVDEIGVGGGVADRLQELGFEVVFVNSSERDAGKGFYNRRAEIYQTGADLFENGQVQIQADDTDLREQLSWAKYKTVRSNGVFQVEPKEDIKDRYGRSPDNADAFLAGLWALPRVRVAERRDGYSVEKSAAYRFNPRTA